MAIIINYRLLDCIIITTFNLIITDLYATCAEIPGHKRKGSSVLTTIDPDGVGNQKPVN